MDPAVAIVDAYLTLNGYFTVLEYPLFEARRGALRVATDIDVLAFRFPGAGYEVTRRGRRVDGAVAFKPDPALECSASQADMIVGEVKQGRATFNASARDPLVIAAALARFGCCEPAVAEDTARRLLQHGTANAGGRHAVRMVAFGTRLGGPSRWLALPMDHVVAFLQRHLQTHWRRLGRAGLHHPALAYLALFEKIAQAEADPAAAE